MSSCIERFGNTVDQSFQRFFGAIGKYVGANPRKTIFFSFLLATICGGGIARWSTESRPEKLWVPQGTKASIEEESYLSYFSSEARISRIIIESTQQQKNVLTKESLIEVMKMHTDIETKTTTVDGKTYSFLDICFRAGGTCANPAGGGVCNCLVNSILKVWNYDLDTLVNDSDYMTTLNSYGDEEVMKSVLGDPTFDTNGNVLSAQAFAINYFLTDQSTVKNGNEVDEISDGWEKDVFLNTVKKIPDTYTSIQGSYFATRSFSDEFGDEISGDLILVQVSYIMAFLFLAANLGRFCPGPGSRWTLSLGALFAVGLSIAAGFGVSSLVGLFYGPVHSLLPFILLGIGVDDVFVIVNAFNRERKLLRSQEDNDALATRCSKALARAGASITVTSATDLVAFGISASSRLPALASFCGYAAISIFFLWLFAATFFSGTVVLDERRQRDNRRECLCCIKRKSKSEDDSDSGDDDLYKDGLISRYFRNYHAPTILSTPGKVIVGLLFSCLLGYGIWGAINLSVQDSERTFIPSDSYLNDFLEASDEYFPSSGNSVFFVFQGSSDIFESKDLLADLNTRLSGLSEDAPFIAEPSTSVDGSDGYRNVMTALRTYLQTATIDGITLGDDNWPTNEEDFVQVLSNYASFSGPGSAYASDVSFSEDKSKVNAIQVVSQYVRLTKVQRGRTIEDAERQIDAMDETRIMVNSWTDLPQPFVYSEKFIAVEGFKLIRRELFLNVGLSIAAVGLIVFFTIASPLTAIFVTANVAFCIVEILGCMYALGIVIDSVSVINIVLAVGLSVDYSAHVGHCFMVKGGKDRNKRVLEALVDIGAAVLNGALSTFLAVFVLLFSKSYVFRILSQQFAITVCLGLIHGLVLLPVMLSIAGPKPFSSAEKEEHDDDGMKKTEDLEL